jgi:murein peptide amidase A
MRERAGRVRAFGERPVIGMAALVTFVSLGGLSVGGCASDFGLETPRAFQPDPIVRRSTLIPERDSTWKSIGVSVLGKPILAATIGDGPKRLYIIGGIHGDEPEGPLVAAALPATLSEMPGLGEWTIRIVRDMNPDGTARRKRGNQRGIDLNRLWPSPTFKPMPPLALKPLSENETAAVHADLEAFKPDIVMLFESSHLGPRVHSAGRDGKLAPRFAGGARLVNSGWQADFQGRYDVPGSLRSWLAGSKARTLLSIDFKRGRDQASNIAAVRSGILRTLTGDGAMSSTPERAEATKSATAKTSAKPGAAKPAGTTSAGEPMVVTTEALSLNVRN